MRGFLILSLIVLLALVVTAEGKAKKKSTSGGGGGKKKSSPKMPKAEKKKRDFYEVLGVSKDATDDAIKKSYKKLARKYHPDISKEDNAKELMVDINEAYTTLSDPEKRKSYDLTGSDTGAGSYSGGWGDAGAGSGSPYGQQHGAGGSTTFSYSFSGDAGKGGQGGGGGPMFADIFADLMGGGAGGKKKGVRSPFGSDGGGDGGSGSIFDDFDLFGGAAKKGKGKAGAPKNKAKPRPKGKAAAPAAGKPTNKAKPAGKRSSRPPPKGLVRPFFEAATWAAGPGTETGGILKRGKDFYDLVDLANVAAATRGATGFSVNVQGTAGKLVFALGKLRERDAWAWPLYLLGNFSAVDENGATDYYYAAPGVADEKHLWKQVLRQGKQWHAYADLARLAAEKGAAGFVEAKGSARLVRTGYKAAKAPSAHGRLFALGNSTARAGKARWRAGELAELTPERYNEFCFKAGRGGAQAKPCLLFFLGADPAEKAYAESAAKRRPELRVMYHTPDHAAHVPENLRKHLGCPASSKYSVLLDREAYGTKTVYAYSRDPASEDKPWRSFKGSKKPGYPQPW
ncbi:Chaperone protein DnaJ [Diplonema papillatum]|nr:Chaperone protein DnaJ [Diplonema papillatum]